MVYDSVPVFELFRGQNLHVALWLSIKYPLPNITDIQLVPVVSLFSDPRIFHWFLMDYVFSVWQLIIQMYDLDSAMNHEILAKVDHSAFTEKAG